MQYTPSSTTVSKTPQLILCDNLICGTEEQVMNKSSYAKMVFMASIKQETNI